MLDCIPYGLVAAAQFTLNIINIIRHVNVSICPANETLIRQHKNKCISRLAIHKSHLTSPPPVLNARRTTCVTPNPERASLHAVTPRPPGNALNHCCVTLVLPAACSQRIPFVCKLGGSWQREVHFLSLVTLTFDL